MLICTIAKVTLFFYRNVSFPFVMRLVAVFETAVHGSSIVFLVYN